jgi:hypothetical protein
MRQKGRAPKRLAAKPRAGCWPRTRITRTSHARLVQAPQVHGMIHRPPRPRVPGTRTNTLASVRLLGPHYGRCAPVLARTRPFDQAPAAGGLNGTGVPMADHRAGRYVSHRRFGIGDLAQALVRLQCKLFCAPKN